MPGQGLAEGWDRAAVASPAVATASVGGVVWEDRNADGVWEAGEPGLGNVSVTLEDCGQPGAHSVGGGVGVSARWWPYFVLFEVLLWR